MTLLIIGLAIWTAAHLLKSLAPAARAGLSARLGAGPARGVMAAAILAGLVLMILGYRRGEFVPLYDPPAWGVHLNNALMLLSVLCFGAAGKANFVSRFLRHPMLTGVLLWAAAHLAANGDALSVALFAGLALWATLSIIAINSRDGAWERPGQPKPGANVRLVAISVAVFAAIGAVHGYVLGVWPFPG